MNGMRSWLGRATLAAALTSALTLATLVSATPAAADDLGNWVTFHGCIVTINDDVVVMRVRGAGRGPAGLQAFARNEATQIDSDVNNDACVAVAAWQEDGQWYAATATAEHDGDGNVEVTTRRRGGD